MCYFLLLQPLDFQCCSSLFPIKHLWLFSSSPWSFLLSLISSHLFFFFPPSLMFHLRNFFPLLQFLQLQFVTSPPWLPLKAGSHILSSCFCKLFQNFNEDINETRINNGAVTGSLQHPSWHSPYGACTTRHGLQPVFILYHVDIYALMNLFCHHKSSQVAL